MNETIINLFLSDYPIKYGLKIFPDMYYENINRLYSSGNNLQNRRNKSRYMGCLTNKYVYSMLPEGVMEEIKRRNPKININGIKRRKYKIYEFLTIYGIEELQEILKKIILIMSVSRDKNEFQENYNRVFYSQT